MKIALYAIRYDKGWSFEISLDLRVDLLWWTSDKRKNSRIQRMIFISSSIPLGWAIQCKQYLHINHTADQWRPIQWKQHIDQWLLDRMRKYNHPLYQVTRFSFIPIEPIQLLWDCNHSTIEDIIPWLSTIEENQGKLAGYPLSSSWKRKAMLGAREFTDMMKGRSLLVTEYILMMSDQQIDYLNHWKTYTQLAYLEKSLQSIAAVTLDELDFLSQIQCRRCGSTSMNYTACASCGSSACAYCETCLNLGRSRECTLLIQSVHQPKPHFNFFSSIRDSMTVHEDIQQRWGLSPAQTEATTNALTFLTESSKKKKELPISNIISLPRIFLSKIITTKVQKLFFVLSRTSYFTHKRFLLWAVTGAGKTEMIFPLIDRVLKNNGKVLVATPRRDVVLELAPRMAKAFPDTTIAVLYGGSEDRWREAYLTIATTHQLLRFSQAFDLVILDELDAFPFHNDPMLAYAANVCCKCDGAFVYLSATPPSTLQKEIKRGLLAHAKVPARFHGHPLPVPKHISISKVSDAVQKKQLSPSLLKYLRYSVTRQAQVFIFVSRIALIEPLVALLRSYFPQLPIEGTSSKDDERAEKVILFRKQEIRMLVTTTILERGVTIPYSDVYILDADSGLFDASSLVQMAGRAGRSKEDPAGNVIFASKQWTIEQKKAVSQIKLMNRTARRKGYLHSSKLKI